MTTKPKSVKAPAVAADTYAWADPYGGAWGAAANWTATTTNTTATSGPGAANAVSISGGVYGMFGNILGFGAAAQLSISNDVILWGSVAVGGAITLAPAAMTSLVPQIISGAGSVAALSVNTDTAFSGKIAVAGQFSVAAANGSPGAVEVTLENGAGFTVGSVDAYSALELIGGSTLSVTAASASNYLNGIDVLGGRSVRLLRGNNSLGGVSSVDGTSSLEVGGAGGAAAGTLTIDAGVSVNADGGGASIAANIVVNGTLVSLSGVETIAGFGGAIGAVS